MFPAGVEGADRRVRLRPHRAHARPDGGARSARPSTSKAEQARLEAYAFFEFGPERRLKAFDPGLAIEVEGLIWFGARDKPGLAELIAKRAARRAGARDAARPRRGAGRRRRDAGRQREQGDGRDERRRSSCSARAWRRCSSSRRSRRRSWARGAGCGGRSSSAPCSACWRPGITWLLAQTLLQSLEQFGEKLEAVVGPRGDRACSCS